MIVEERKKKVIKEYKHGGLEKFERIGNKMEEKEKEKEEKTEEDGKKKKYTQI